MWGEAHGDHVCSSAHLEISTSHHCIDLGASLAKWISVRTVRLGYKVMQIKAHGAHGARRRMNTGR